MKLNEEFAIKVAEILKAAGHPVRIKILRLLKNGKLPVKEIHKKLGLTQSETSRHLILLKNVSALCSLKEGNNSYYFINDKDPFIKQLTECLYKA
jgi:ArsR family transcriptional regulator